MANTFHVPCPYCGDSVPEHAYDSACHRQAEADRRLGALVRRMKPSWALVRDDDGTFAVEGDTLDYITGWHEEPDAALDEALGED